MSAFVLINGLKKVMAVAILAGLVGSVTLSSLALAYEGGYGDGGGERAPQGVHGLPLQSFEDEGGE
jgi:hypothetical protein